MTPQLKGAIIGIVICFIAVLVGLFALAVPDGASYWSGASVSVVVGGIIGFIVVGGAILIFRALRKGDKKMTNPQPRYWVTYLLLSALVLIGVFIYGMALWNYRDTFGVFASQNHSRWGEFGDFIGGVLNPAFSFLGFIALLWTIAIQSKELRNSSHELKNSSDALKEQSEAFRIQNFESAFFQMLRLHNDIVNSMDLVSKVKNIQRVTKGRDCLRVFFYRFKSNMNRAQGTESLEKMRKAYEKFYENNEHEIGHYFRLLYNIVKFVHYSSMKDKRFYINLVRAQLSSDELLLLFFNGLNKWGIKRFKPLIEDYGLLETIPENELIIPLFRDEYKETAFQGLPPAEPIANS